MFALDGNGLSKKRVIGMGMCVSLGFADCEKRKRKMGYVLRRVMAWPVWLGGFMR